MSSKIKRFMLSSYFSYALLGLIMLIPLVMTDPYSSHIMILGGIYVILALGQNIVTGYCGQIHLGMAGFYAIGSYTSAILSTTFGVSFWLAMPASALLAALAGVVVGVPGPEGARRGLPRPGYRQFRGTHPGYPQSVGERDEGAHGHREHPGPVRRRDPGVQPDAMVLPGLRLRPADHDLFDPPGSFPHRPKFRGAPGK